ncbi:MAG: sugar transferase [Oscillospiraceae bacterium]|nr:sugar transferase [Oscillospiraceae bacterium]
MYRFVKRFFDFTLSLMAFIVLSPILLIVALAIKLDSQGPVFFKQERVGKDGKLFTIYKFRSMSTAAPKDCPTHMLEGSTSFITKVGGFLRKTSLDELPQLINIIKNDMSIIGPRPALEVQQDLLDIRKQNGSYNLKPGLTGWAQANGRDELEIEVKARFDGEYAQNIGFAMDLKCFLLTIKKVLTGDGVQEGVHETTKE